MRYLSILTMICLSLLTSQCRVRQTSSTKDAGVDPELQQKIDDARRVLLIVGKGNGTPDSENHCAGACHGLDVAKVKQWGTATAKLQECMKKAPESVQQGDPDFAKKVSLAQIACFKNSPTSTVY